MGFWESSGAAAIYGVVAGGVIAAGTSILSNRHAATMAKTERESRAAEAIINREHELLLEDRRATREMRLKFYPSAAESILAATTSINSHVQALKSDPDAKLNITKSDEELRQTFTSLIVLSSPRTKEALDTFIADTAQALQDLEDFQKASVDERSPKLANLEASAERAVCSSSSYLNQCVVT